MEFQDLPKYQQDLIRRNLIQEAPIYLTSRIDYDQNVLQPKLKSIPSAIRRVARKAFYQQNTFYLNETSGMLGWYIGEEECSLIRKIGVFGNLVNHERLLARFDQLQEVEIGVDEAFLVKNESSPRDGYQPKVLRPQDIPYTLNLVVLRNPGVAELLSLRFPKVQFVQEVDFESGNIEKRRRTGPIPGGVLETIVAPKMMSQPIGTPLPSRGSKRKADGTIYVARPSGSIKPRTQAYMKRMMSWTKIGGNDASPSEETVPAPESKTESTFRFLDLPPELRNKVYSLILCHTGPINAPQRASPFTFHDHKSLVSLRSYLPDLTILLVNKQILDEASGVYYQLNTFVFFYPLQCMMYLETIGSRRRSLVTTISLWYKSAYSQGNMSLFDFAALQLRNLPNLQKLEICLDEKTAKSCLNETAKGIALKEIPGEKYLMQMAKAGVNISFRCLEADAILWLNSNEDGSLITNKPYETGRARYEMSKARSMLAGARDAEKRFAKK